ncbi:glycosyltransferase family 2 protein [Sutcliffiella halmapala]
MYKFGDTTPTLTIVIPCYNEEAVLHETTKRMSLMIEELMNEMLISPDSKILYVDDGSKDRTWDIIEEQSEGNWFVKGLKLAGNVGHQNALLAGLQVAGEHSDCVISIDADLQDDITVMRDFILKFHEGYDIVYGVRDDRTTDSFFKKNTAQFYYKLMGAMGVNLVYNHADYRLLSHRVLTQLSQFQESNLFLRGIIPLIGFKQTKVYYKRHERFAGESKYPLRKMLSFAMEGITSFSVTPIRLLTVIGIFFLLLSMGTSVYSLIQKVQGETVSGWTSLMLSIWFIGGIQLMGLGLIGEYISKIYMEVKKRPKYHIDINHYSSTNREADRRNSSPVGGQRDR